MASKSFLLGSILLFMLLAVADARKKKIHSFIGKMQDGGEMMLADDPLFTVEAIKPLGTKIGTCSCECCQPAPSALVAPPCGSDIIVVVDSSACFRDHQRRMKAFLTKLAAEIHRSEDHKYGINATRLSIMQFSDTQVLPIRLDDFENYQNPPSSKALKNEIVRKINSLTFLGQGAYLDKALEAAYTHFQNAQPRPFPQDIKRSVIVLTNGRSHADVTEESLASSIQLLKGQGIKIFPVSVTRQCYGGLTGDWDEGLCPDAEVLRQLGEGSYRDEDFLAMRTSGTVSAVASEATECPQGPAPLVELCNTCNCSCELPIGPMGPRGDKGPKGDAIEGPRGDQGPQGDIGFKGDRGPQGIQGIKGATGEDGPRGHKGDEGQLGPEGEKGSDGDRGPKGDIGDIGPIGPKGDIGDRGETGSKGSVGDKGEFGEPGQKGRKGEDGFEGPIGPAGPKGEPGIGIQGNKGDEGERGEKGDEGDTGEPGNEGPKGNQGLCGKPGPAGLKGETGMPGIDGADGQQGEQGIQGPRGPEGLQGAKGVRGTPGRNGEEGPTGPRGQDGPEGPQGPRGEPGNDGRDSNVPGPRGEEGQRGQKGERGQAGADGLDGRQGPQGDQGPRGPSGQKGEQGTIDADSLRPLISELIRELLPGECVDVGNLNQCSEYPVDLVFLIDGSDSIAREDFDAVKSWILKTVDRFNPADRSEKLRLDVVQFSEQVSTEVEQIVQTSSEEVRATVEGIEQMRSGTKTYTGLRYINSDITPGTRDRSFRILITMTDGDASEDRDQAAIDEARGNYDLMLAVGIGDKIHKEELEDFAYRSEPISVEEFASLGGIIDKIVEASCKNIQEGQGRPSGGTTTRPEWKEPTPPPLPKEYSKCADSRADIAFLLDGSSSVGEEDFELLKKFLLNMIESFDLISSNGFRVAIVQYNEMPRIELNFDASVDKEAVMEAIERAEYMTGNTRTGYALETVGDMFEGIRISGRRRNVPQVAVVITDGRSQDDTVTPSRELKDAGVTLFAVGVTDSSLHDELTIIASSEDKVYDVESYDAIEAIKDSLLKNICASVRGSYIGDDGLLTEGSGSDVPDPSIPEIDEAEFEEDFDIGELP